MSAAPIAACLCPPNTDSPLSTTANIAGILTFVYALLAGVFGYFYLLRSFTRSDDSIARFYDAFAACALESDLVRRDILASSSANLVLDEALDSGNEPDTATYSGEKGIAQGLKAASSIPLPARAEPNRSTARPSRGGPYSGAGGAAAPDVMESPYLLDPDSLARLYSHVRALEIDLQRSAAKAVYQNAMNAKDKGWTGTWDRLLGRGKWINRAGDLQAGLEKREALTPRLLVVQMSLAAGRLRTQAERMGELEDEIERLKSKVDTWETVVESESIGVNKLDV